MKSCIDFAARLADAFGSDVGFAEAAGELLAVIKCCFVKAADAAARDRARGFQRLRRRRETGQRGIEHAPGDGDRQVAGGDAEAHGFELAALVEIDGC